MDTIQKLNSLHNPYRNTDIILNRELRVWALKSFAKLYWIELKTRKNSNTKLPNIFSENKELLELIEKEKLTPEDNNKIHNIIVEDFTKLQHDLDKSRKAKYLSKNSLKKSKIKSNNILWKLDKMFKPDAKIIFKVWKKTWLFCLKHNVKTFIWTTVVLLSWITAIIAWTQTFTAQGKGNTIPTIWKVNTKKSQINKKVSIEKINKYSKKISDFSFKQISTINPQSDDFSKIKKLYLTFMKKITKQIDIKDNLKLNDTDFKAYLKMEYMYNIWIKKNLLIKKNNSSLEKTSIILWKLNTTNIQLELLKKSYDDYVLWTPVNITYQKHWLDININTTKWNIITGMNQFKY